MREYSKVGPSFWIGPTGKRLRSAGPEAQIVALYLMTSPHANMLGLYYCPVMFIAHETGLGLEGASKGLQSAIEAGFCEYDETSEVVWVVEMATFQIDEALKPADHRCKGVQSEYASLPENPFLSRFYDKYSAAFCMSARRGKPSPLEAPSKPLRSQEQEQEQEQEHKTQTSASLTGWPTSVCPETDSQNPKTDEPLPPDEPLPDGAGADAPVLRAEQPRPKPLRPEPPPCPLDRIVEAYAKALPTLPQPRLALMIDKRKRAVRDRWRDVLTRPIGRDGQVPASDAAGALRWFEKFFGYVASSPFLLGQTKGWTGATLDWLMHPDNFAKVLSGQYHLAEVAA